MNPRAVARSKQAEEIDTYAFQHKLQAGTMVVVNGSVQNISLSLEAIEQVGQRERILRTITDLSLSDAKSLYLVLRSMLNVLGDLDKLDECVL